MRSSKLFVFLIATAFFVGCTRSPTGGSAPPSTALSEVPAVRLTYRYEADVPAPEIPARASEDRSKAVQADFDQNRPQEMLDRTVTSPKGDRVAAVYHKASDTQSEFRLDMYSTDGKLLQKVTSDLMAVHFPDTISWSPNSEQLAFVAMLRAVSTAQPTPEGPDTNQTAPTPAPEQSADANTAPPDSNANTTQEPAAQAPASTPEAPTGIMTYRTEQLYICGADGAGAKPLTQNEGFIYFYYVWSPDSKMLAALALHSREWDELQRRADAAGEIFLPLGRPRVIELSGRERRLDDALTAVQPVWSPDSSKVAEAFDTQVRIYDALGTNPTQAAVPLRNDLLLSSRAYDLQQAAALNADANANSTSNSDANSNANTNVNTAANAAPAPASPANGVPSTLPDPSTLVSFNPIVGLAWTSPEMLYLHTAFVRRMKNEADSVNSFARWHRLIFSASPPAA